MHGRTLESQPAVLNTASHILLSQLLHWRQGCSIGDLIFRVSVCRMYVDEVLIRIFQNYEDQGVPYLRSDKAMQVYMSIFDGSSWATRGGLDKIDWSHSPFNVRYKDIIIDACVVDPASIMASPCARPEAGKFESRNLLVAV